MFKKSILFIFTLLFTLSFSSIFSQSNRDERKVMFFDSPAPKHDILPNPRGLDKKGKPRNYYDYRNYNVIGNGRLGGHIYGGTKHDRLWLNEDSMWFGYANAENDDFKDAFPGLQKTREMIKNAKSTSEYKKAADFGIQNFLTEHGYGSSAFGKYTTFFRLNVIFNELEETSLIEPGHKIKRSVKLPSTNKNYRRELDLNNSIATVSFEEKGVKHHREYFASNPDEVIVAHYSASKPVSGTIYLKSNHEKGSKITSENDYIDFTGKVINSGTEKGTNFNARIYAKMDDGNIIPAENGTLKFENTKSFTVFILGNTDYKEEYPLYKSEISPLEKTLSHYEKIKNKDWKKIKEDHIADYQELFNRVDFKLFGEDFSNISTKQRKLNHAKARTESKDRALEELIFHFGRYLMISSSRKNGLPANLQGLWNVQKGADWTGDYHANINVQMNYWMNDIINLQECNDPFFRFLEDKMAPAKKTAKIHYNSPGMVMHHTLNPFGFVGPGNRRGKHMMESECAAWLSRHFWERYQFTGDKEHLKTKGWPFMKEIITFWMHPENTEKNKEGKIFVNPAYSPEHGYLTNKAFFQSMVLWDLFSNSIEAAKICGENPEYIKSLIKFKSQLPDPKVGKAGQLMEWNDESLEEERNYGKSHRHISHFYSIYPSHQINPDDTPELMDAVQFTFDKRGLRGTGWSLGWKIHFAARLRDKEKASALITLASSNGVVENLLGTHPPFQIDANFGYVSGVCEMILQSHKGELHFLPVLPDNWTDGELNRIIARGGFEVSVKWKGGKLYKAKIKSLLGNPLKVRYGGTTKTFELKKGESINLGGKLNKI